METDRVSFIVVTYNSSPTIRECLRSIRAQTDVTPELIVVDNGSSDCTLKILVNELAPDVLLANQVNMGFASACNQGARAASGRYFAFVNPDAKLAPNWAAKICNVLDKESEVGAADGKLLLWRDPRTINVLGSHLNLLGFGCMGHFMESDASSDEVLDSAYPSGAAFVIKLDAFAETGGFDGSYFLYQEDVDLGLRLRLCGWKVATVSSAVGHHDYKSSLTPTKTKWLECNRWRTLIKNMPLQYFVRMWLLLTISEFFIVLSVAKRGLLGAKAQGYLELFRSLRTTMRARHAVETTSRDRLRLLDLLKADLPILEGADPRSALIAKRILRGYIEAIGLRPAYPERGAGISRGSKAKVH